MGRQRVGIHNPRPGVDSRVNPRRRATATVPRLAGAVSRLVDRGETARRASPTWKRGQPGPAERYPVTRCRPGGWGPFFGLVLAGG